MKTFSTVVSVALGLGAALVGERAWAAGFANLVLSGTATQSSTFTWGTVGASEASRAIDGNANGDWYQKSVTHTDVGDPDPWWQVELSETSALSRIVLWNRTDCCWSNRLSNFRVAVLDEFQAEVFGQTYFSDGMGSFSESFPIDLPNNTKGHYVRITLGPNASDLRVLSLAEAQVFGPAACENGDVNGDQEIDVSDVIYLLLSLFADGPRPLPIPVNVTRVNIPVGLPATGQRTCYDEAGNVIDCESSTCPGQDGLYVAGCPNEARFIDNPDPDSFGGTVTDTCTGLMWQKASVGPMRPMTWTQALAYCEGLAWGGSEAMGVYDDWRLPNVRELESITDMGRFDPAIDPVFNSATDIYWSSTPWALVGGWDSNAWYCSTDSGGVFRFPVWAEHSVRAVRGGP